MDEDIDSSGFYSFSQLENQSNFVGTNADHLPNQSQSDVNFSSLENSTASIPQLYPPLLTPPSTPAEIHFSSYPSSSHYPLQPVTAHIQNVVSTVNLQCKLNLNEISKWYVNKNA